MFINTSYPLVVPLNESGKLLCRTAYVSCSYFELSEPESQRGRARFECRKFDEWAACPLPDLRLASELYYLPRDEKCIAELLLSLSFDLE